MSDTVAAIEANVSAEITQTQGVVDNVTALISDLLTKLNSLASTMFIPAAPDLSAISYPGTTQSNINGSMHVPDLPSGIDSPPQADTSVTYLDADYSKRIDTSKVLAEKDKFVASVLASAVNPAQVKVSFVYKDPLAETVTGDGGSAIVLLVAEKITTGMAGYLVLDDLWAADSFDAGRERDAVELERAAVRVQSKWAGLGYDSAPGMAAAEITDEHQKYLDEKLKQSQALGIKQYDVSFAFRQAMLSAATSIASAALSHANAVQGRALDAAKSVARLAIDQYNLLVARWQNKVEAAKLPVDVAVENLKLKVEKAGLEATGAAEDYSLSSYEFKLATQKYKNDLVFYQDTLRQFSHQLGLAEVNDRVAVMNDGITLREAETKARVSLELARLALHALAETMSSEIHAIAAGGKIYSNAISSVNNAVATLVTLGNLGEKAASSDT